MTINIYCKLNRIWNHWIYKLLSISMKKYQLQINWNGDSYPKHGGTNPWPRLLTEIQRRIWAKHKFSSSTFNVTSSLTPLPWSPNDNLHPSTVRCFFRKFLGNNKTKTQCPTCLSLVYWEHITIIFQDYNTLLVIHIKLKSKFL